MWMYFDHRRSTGAETRTQTQRSTSYRRFAPDYTFYLNLLFTLIAVAMIWLHRRYTKEPGHMQHDMAGDSKTKRVIAMAAAVILISGLLVRIVSDI